MDIGSICPRCSEMVLITELDHDAHCLDKLLARLYELGVQRGLAGDRVTDFDQRAAGLVQTIGALTRTPRTPLILRWPLAGPSEPAPPASASVPAPLPSASVLAPIVPFEDDNTLIARLLGFQDIGWLDGRLVSGEQAWHDPRVARRRFTSRYEDAQVLLRLPMLRPYELLQIHRLHTQSWEWHMAFKNGFGNMETLVREASAALAICSAALMLSGARRVTRAL